MNNRLRDRCAPHPARPLGRAIRRALRERQRPCLRFGAGLVALGLAGQVPAVSAAVFPAEIELSGLASGGGNTGFVLNGIDFDDFSGRSVSAAGDVNGDGIDDLIVGARQADPGGRANAGESYVVFGRTGGFSAEVELSSLLSANGGDGSAGFVLNGIDNDDSSGRSVSAAGDVNGDGIDDLIVGADAADPDGRLYAGESYVVFGRAGGFPAELELSSLLFANMGNGSAGFVLNGIDNNDRSGFSVSAAGDVNGDGIDDLIVGAYGADPDGRSFAGESYVVFGRDQETGGFPAELELSSLLSANMGNGTAGFVLNGIDNLDFSGRSVSAAGDINGDGIDDLIVGAYRADPGGRSYAGESYVVFGRDQEMGGFPAELELSSLLSANMGNGSAGFVLNGVDIRDFSCRSVSAAGDVNNDGIDDLIVGAEAADPGGRSAAGESYVIFGRDPSISSFPAEIELSSLASGGGTAGFVLNGIDPGDTSGFSVSAAGDINFDGIDDLIIGAFRGAPDGRSEAGESYVVFGRDQATGGFPAELELSSLLLANMGDGSGGFVLNGIDSFDWSGFSVSAAGDVNGDGIDDVIVGAYRADPAGGGSSAGESYVVFGRAPDTDGDGFTDNVDNCPTTANADQADGDADTVGDACDNCIEHANANQCNTNAGTGPGQDLFGNRCDADLNNDGGVTQSDLGLFRSQFNQTGSDLDADLDCDGGVTQTDLGLFRSLFNQPPGPSGL